MTIKIFHAGKEIKYNHFVFPDGAEHIRLDVAGLKPITDGDGFGEDIHYIGSFKSSSDIIKILLLRDAVDQALDGIFYNPHLHIRYLPYARQDRVCYPGEPHASDVFASLILKDFHAEDVIILDPHSESSLGCLRDECALVIRYPYAKLRADFWRGTEAVISPDKGAKDRAALAAATAMLPVIECGKARNPENGEITGFSVPDGIPESVAIIDDICDGGGTFCGLAKILREKGAKQIKLFVTHGIFSKGLAPFDGLIDEIWTTNSFYDSDSIGIQLEIRKVK